MPSLARKIFEFFTSERIMEYPFLHANIKVKGGTILDVGPGRSSLPIELASRSHKVWAIDIKRAYPIPITHPNFTFVHGDIRKTTFPDNFFDVVTAVSSIEHIGLGDQNDPDGDRKAIQEIARILKPGGNFIITIPFGKKSIYYKKGKPLCRVYNMSALKSLLTGFKIVKKEFGIRKDGAWFQASSEQVKDLNSTKQVQWLASMAVAMIVAQKR